MWDSVKSLPEVKESSTLASKLLYVRPLARNPHWSCEIRLSESVGKKHVRSGAILLKCHLTYSTVQQMLSRSSR